jgi:type II secretory pathway pseudopilin PulG
MLINLNDFQKFSQSSSLIQRIQKEEKELEALEQAMSMLKNSNDQYRETNLRTNASKMETEEISALKDQAYSKERQIKQVGLHVLLIK